MHIDFISKNHLFLNKLILSKIVFFIIPAITFVLPVCAQSRNKSFDIDISGIRRFWEIYDVLKSDHEPTEAQWNALFATPGYSLIESKEHRRKGLTEAIRLAYMPSKQAERENRIKNAQGWVAYFLPHFIEIPKFRQEFEIFFQKDRLEKLFTEARGRAQKFLPDETTKRVAPPPVSFIFFSARGYQERILLDPLELLHKLNRAGLVGHELHHHYYHHVAESRGKWRSDEGDLLANAIVNVEVEGVAGEIDKGDIPKMSLAELEKNYQEKTALEYYKQYQIIYAHSNEWLKFSEKLLEQIADAKTPEEKAALGKRLHEELPDNGRAMGTFMTDTIIKYLGRRKLIKTLGDSFDFWQVYNQAAKRSKGQAYALSDKAIIVIRQTGEKYRLSQT